MQTNILEYLEYTVRRVPYNTAFTDGIVSMTFKEVYDQARAIGSFLYRKGFRGQAVAVLMGKHPRTLTAFLGAVYGGNYYVPLDTDMPRHRIEWILNTVQSPVLLYDDSTKDLVEALSVSACCCHYEEAAFGIIEEADLSAVRHQQLDIDPIYVVFTSGSTGIPKGVMGCHRAVIDYVENMCPVLGFDENTVFGNQTPLYFDACLKEVLPALKFGGCVHLIPGRLFSFPVRLVEYLNLHKINTLCWVVSALTMISGFGALEIVVPKFVHTVAFASEVFPVRQLNKWRAALPHARFFNLYGPTETTGICCYYEVNRGFSEKEVIPIGRPFPNTQILLLDENGKLAESGQPGEICIRGTRLTLGYFVDMERTEEAFVQNPLNPLYPDPIYRTGDMGQYNDRGELVFLSRKDHQIKHMGHRIELGEIESAANCLAGVQSACCSFDPVAKKICLHFAGTVSPADLSSFLKERLPRYMLPNRILTLDSIPLTPNGKIDRKKLAEQIRRT